MTTNSFSYNGLDTRVGLTDSSGTKTFKRAGVGVTAPVLSDGTANFTPSGEKRGSTKTTFHSALKNSDIQTNSSGAVSASKQFDAFGNEVSSNGSWRSQFAYAGGFGYQQDFDTGLKLLGHRYYDSDTGRFLTRDPIGYGRNWYSYCANNPINQIDSSGQIPLLILAAVVVFVLLASSPDAEAPGLPGSYSMPKEERTAAKLEAAGEAAQQVLDAPKPWKWGKYRNNHEPGGEHRPFENRSTYRQRYWRERAKEKDAEATYGAENVERMSRGSAPQRQRSDGSGKMESMELSHEPTPYSQGGTTFKERWPQEHAAKDPNRHPGY